MATNRKRSVKLTASAATATPTSRRRVTGGPGSYPPLDDLPDDIGDDRPDDSGGGSTVVGEAAGIMAEMGSLIGATGASVTVYRLVKNKRPAYVFECDPQSFSLDDLRSEYGGGDFTVYIHKDGELYKNIRVSVETPRAKPVDAESAAVAALRDDMAKQGKILEALALRMAAPPPAPVSPLASIFSGASLPETIGAISTMLQMLRPPAPPPPPAAPPPGSDTATAIDMLMKGIELARELNGGEKGESSLMDVVRDMVKSPFIAQAIEAAAHAQAPAAQPQRRLARPRPAPPPGAAPHTPNPLGPTVQRPAPQQFQHQQPTSQHEGQDMRINSHDPNGAAVATVVNPLVQYMEFLNVQAANDADPEVYAALVLDNLDDDTINALLSREPDPVTALLQDYPPAAAYREWYEDLVAIVADAVSGEDEGGGGEDDDSEIGAAGVAPDSDGGVIDVEAVESRASPPTPITSHASGAATPVRSRRSPAG